jgi:serine/threonine protein kinase
VESEAELKIIEREIELHSSLDHPHIIKIWDTLVEDSIVYMVMDSAERGNLFFHQNSKGKFQEA